MIEKKKALLFVSAAVLFNPLFARSHDVNLCVAGEVNIAACKTTKGQYASFCASRDNTHTYYRFGTPAKIELTIKFNPHRTLYRWQDLSTYITFLGFNNPEYSYVFGVPQETPGAKAFLLVKKIDEAFSYRDTFTCTSNAFGNTTLNNRSIKDIDDATVRQTGAIVFPPIHEGAAQLSAPVLTSEHVSSTPVQAPNTEDTEGFLWSGDYSSNSELCTVPNSGESCASTFRDHLKIRPQNSHYVVELSSTQASEHVCYFQLEMRSINGALTHETGDGNIGVIHNGASLEIVSSGIDPTAPGLGFCGAHAGIDGLTFPISSKFER